MREAIIGGAICRFRNYERLARDRNPMTHFTVSQFSSARHAGLGQPSGSCSTPASGRWDAARPVAVVVAALGKRGRVAHRFDRDRRPMSAVGYQVMLKDSVLELQPRGEDHGADSDEDHTP
ncbi:MAG: hypothetical protein ABIT20_24680 [Gemmatimonadaceae bacterium]